LLDSLLQEMLSFVTVAVSCVLGGVMSVPVRYNEPPRYEPPKEVHFKPLKENDGWWYDTEATPWVTRGAQLQNSPFYHTYRQLDKQLDMYGYAQHAGNINRGEYYNPELNLPGDRAFGFKGDFNAKDLDSGAFRHSPRGQQVVAEQVHVDLGMADELGEIITVGAGQFIKPDGTILLHTLPSPNPCNNPNPCANVFPGHKATCVALDTTTAKCERIVNGGVAGIVNGRWSNWAEFSDCDADCKRERTRTCDNGACVGQGTEIEDCTGDESYEDDCGWGEWIFADPNDCDSQCVTSDVRECKSNDGKQCDGPGSYTLTDFCQTGEGQCDRSKLPNK